MGVLVKQVKKGKNQKIKKKQVHEQQVQNQKSHGCVFLGFWRFLLFTECTKIYREIYCQVRAIKNGKLLTGSQTHRDILARKHRRTHILTHTLPDRQRHFLG